MSEKGKVVTPAAPGLINKEDIPQVLPILPLRNSVFFPGGVLPLAVGRQKTIALIKDAVRDDQVIGVVTQRRAEEEDPGASDLYTMGTVATPPEVAMRVRMVSVLQPECSMSNRMNSAPAALAMPSMSITRSRSGLRARLMPPQ